jgi:PKD repeat protein
LEIVHKADVMHSTQVSIISRRPAFVRRAARFACLPLIAVVTVAGCTKKTEAPPPTGPSELGLSVIVTASPDILDLDGLSQSQITVTTRGPDGSPVRDVPLNLDMSFQGELQDVGRLSNKQPTTGGDGRAVVTYTAPAAPTSGNSDSMPTVTITAIPIGNDYKNAVPRSVYIRLRPRGVILPQAGSPIPRFTTSPTDAGEDQDIRFDASSTIPSCFAIDEQGVCTQMGPGSISQYLWEFGNGRTASGVTASTFYSTRGTYTAKLTVTNDRGMVNSTSKEISITGVANPSASFTVSPNTVGVGERVNVDASASQPAPGGDRFLIQYNWTWGDGRTSEGVRQSHTYSNAGSYTITLTVADNTGRTGTATQSVTVGQGILLPVANFTFSPTNPNPGRLISFDATVSTPSAGRTIVRHEWNFGDNSPLLVGNEPRPTHTYSAPGVYVVTLTVVDNTGVRSLAVTKNVTVSP